MNSRWATPDMLTALFVLTALVGAMLVARHPSPRGYVLSGIGVGLATSTKYNAVLVIAALVVAHLLARGEWRWLALAGACAVGAFLLTTPFAVFDFHHFWHDFTGEIHHYQTGHPLHQGDTFDTNVRWLWGSVGPLLLGLLLVPWARSRRLLLVPSSFALVYFVELVQPVVRFERNLVPLIAVLLVVIAVAVVEVGTRRRALLVAFALFAIWPVALTVRDTWRVARDDSLSLPTDLKGMN
jgi:4-amino-4-deoxy-L-arabinose transferase-like glycosyltransferase